jgi:hypothetical protein
MLSNIPEANPTNNLANKIKLDGLLLLQEETGGEGCFRKAEILKVYIHNYV